jgi:hypothetical protein
VRVFSQHSRACCSRGTSDRPTWDRINRRRARYDHNVEPPRRANRRPLPRLGIVLLLIVAGAAVNVAVAWGCAWRWPTRLVALGIPPQGSGIPVWAVGWSDNNDIDWAWVAHQAGMDGYLTESYGSHVAEAIGMRIELHWCVMAVPPDRPRWSDVRAERVTSGWPRLALTGGRREVLASDETILAGRVRHAEPIQALLIPDGGWQRVLPLLPVWPGFAVNTLLYTTVLWLLIVAPFSLRRWRRIRRSQCPACAYPVGASAVCTECGKPVRAGSAEPHA